MPRAARRRPLRGGTRALARGARPRRFDCSNGRPAPGGRTWRRKHSVRGGSAGLLQNACCVTLGYPRWPDGSPSSPCSPSCFPPRRRRGSPRSRCASSRSAASGRLSATSTTRPFQLVGIHWQGPGRLELRTRSPGGALVALAAGTGGQRRRSRPVEQGGAGDEGLAAERARVGRARGRPRGSLGRSCDTRPRADGAEPRLEDPAAPDLDGRNAPDRAAKRVAGRRDDSPGEAGLRRYAADGLRPPHRRDEHVLAPRSRRRSCGGSRSTT